MRESEKDEKDGEKDGNIQRVRVCAKVGEREREKEKEKERGTSGEINKKIILKIVFAKWLPCALLRMPSLTLSPLFLSFFYTHTPRT